jgi:hypothetical protein
MAIGLFASRLIAALVALGSVAHAQTEAPHPFYGNTKFISTINLASTTQFFPLPTNYNTLFLNCQGMIGSSNAFLSLNVGEGGTPTWETAANYTGVSIEMNSGSSTATVGNGTAFGGLITPSVAIATEPISVKLYLDSVASSSVHKLATYQIDNTYYGDTFYRTKYGSTYWNSDTNPITGLQLTLTAGAFTAGTCSLYGMN